MAGKTADAYRAAIAASGLDIYGPIDPEDANLFIPTPLLEELLDRGLRGLDLGNAAARTRSKLVKSAACKALGYPTPATFKKCQPRFTGQDFDTYNQQALNLQIWNEPINPTRRYALVRIGANSKVRMVRVIEGRDLIPLDTTGRLTTKYQAQMIRGVAGLTLLSATDTSHVATLVAAPAGVAKFAPRASPVDQPQSGQLLPIAEIAQRLAPLVGTSFADTARHQDRNRGAVLHEKVCKALGYAEYEDSGQFPDVRHQLLEVKLQTSPTIDLGLVLPESLAAVKGVHRVAGVQPRHCDTRYALFDGEVTEAAVTLRALYVVTGADFFSHFRQFQGNVQNQKIQIPLPRQLFGE